MEMNRLTTVIGYMPNGGQKAPRIGLWSLMGGSSRLDPHFRRVTMKEYIAVGHAHVGMSGRLFVPGVSTCSGESTLIP